MSARLSCFACCLLLLSPVVVRAQKADAVVIDREPVLRLEAGGPTALITGLAFAPNERSLYAAGFDKVVHTWTLDRVGSFVTSKEAYRVPVGPGLTGSINNIAVSSDGVWLAISSRGVVRQTASHRQLGIWIPSPNALSKEMREDEGAIVVYHTRTGEARQLRGHRGRVASMAFAPQRDGHAPVLASFGREFQQNNQFQGVVRLWDLDKGAQLAALTDLPDPVTPKLTLQPRLVVWHAGPKNGLLRVALAYGDGVFRLWGVKAGQSLPVVEAKDQPYMNDVLVQVPNEDMVLTGSYRVENGVLTLWDVAGAKPIKLKEVHLPERQQPRALALFAARPGGPVDRVAVVLRSQAKGVNEYRVSLLDLTSLKDPPIASPLLWTGPAMTPILTVSSGGRFLAVSGNEHHEVHVFAVADLLKNKDQRTRLRGAGTLVYNAVFAKNGDRVGLLLNDNTRFVFDVSRRRLSDNVTGWTPDAPRLTDWETLPEKLADIKNVVRVQHKGAEVGSVRLGSQGVRVTALALLPQADRPLLAVAVVEAGQPLLRLYNVRTGEHIRQLTGHVNDIHSLAFSGEGRLLVSAAADETVCVWSLSDLDQHLGHKGSVPGFFVKEPDAGGGVVVSEIDGEYLTADNQKGIEKFRVQVGDAIEGFVVGGNVKQPLRTAREFYDRVFQTAPGQTVTVRVRKRGDLPLKVGQATDEQKPLLTLFITRASKGTPRQWLGWNPVGPYDFSDAAAERLLGWQQNTGDPKKPALFVEARQLRADYYKSDILRYLVKFGSTGPAIDAWNTDHPVNVPEPKMSLFIKELGPRPPTDAEGRILLEQPPVTLQVALDDVQPDQVRSLTWQPEGAKPRDFVRGADNEWSGDLSGLTWKRGDNKVRVVLQTTTIEGQEFSREMVLRYFPPKPIVSAVAALPGVVGKPMYPLEIKVEPGTGQTVEVVVLNNGKKLDKPETIKAAKKFQWNVPLDEGQNLIKVQAQNPDTGDSDALTVEVRYEKMGPPPQITLTSLVRMVNGADAGDTPIMLNPELLKKPIVVDRPHVRIAGLIEALAPLVAVHVTDTPNRARKPLKLDGKDPNRLLLAHEVVLTEPGQFLKVTFFANTKAGKEVEQTVVLHFTPRLPELTLTAPAENQPFVEGRDKPDVNLVGDLTWILGAEPCTAQVIVNDEDQGKPEMLSIKERRFTGTARLQPGQNSIQIRCTHKWGTTLTTRRTVMYRQPPMVRLTAPAKSNTPFVNVIAEVETPTDLPLTMLNVHGQEVPVSRYPNQEKTPKGDRTVYRIVLANVPLQKNENKIRVLAANRDGWSVKPVEVVVQYEAAVPAKPPRASLLDPAKDAIVDKAEVQLTFLVASKSPLKQVEVQRNGVTVFRKDRDLDAVPKNPNGEFELRETQAVTLQPGPNSLKVVAQNDGGEQESSSVVLTLQTGPARVVITHLEVAGAEVKPLDTVNRTLLFPPVPKGQVVLHGRIECRAPASDAQMEKVSLVRVCVNGFQQMPANLEKAASNVRERRFKTLVRLTRKEGNEVVIKLPDLAEEAGSRNQCSIDCTEPDVTALLRRAHLLIVDTSKEAKKDVVSQVLQALQATPSGKDQFTKPGFADGRIYGPVVGPDGVHGALRVIKRELFLRSSAGQSNDVVFLYFRGVEHLDGLGHVLRTTDRESDPDLVFSGISCDYLARRCAETQGAQLVLLDVTREVPAGVDAHTPLRDKVLEWPDDPNVAVIRYSWSGPPSEQKPETRLLADWMRALTQKKKLSDVVDLLSSRFEVMSKIERPAIKDPRLTYSLQMPAVLGDVVLGK